MNIYELKWIQKYMKDNVLQLSHELILADMIWELIQVLNKVLEMKKNDV